MTAGNKPATRPIYQDFPVIRVWSDTYPATAGQVRHARRDLTGFLGDAPLAADAATCLSELMTNSIKHSHSRSPGGTVTIRATLTGGRLRVEVEDQGGPWNPPPTQPDSPRGRGLSVVAALSDKWGKTGGGTRSRTVWFELADEATVRPPVCSAAPNGSGATELSADDVAAEFPDWRIWKGVSGLWYARLRDTQPPVITRGEDPSDLRDEIRRKLAQAEETRWLASARCERRR